MPQTPHIERHFSGSERVRDVIIGMSDGLTVPFALAAGLTGAVASTAIIVTAGLAEIAAGSIAMGLGGFLAARSEAEHYASERAREEDEIVKKTEAEVEEVVAILHSYGLTRDEGLVITERLKHEPKRWVDFMMRFELGLEEPNPRRALQSGLLIGGAYIAGGLIPLAPYMLLTTTQMALVSSAGVTLFALAFFGYVKGRFTGTHPRRSALHTTLVGGVAATVAFLIARIFA